MPIEWNEKLKTGIPIIDEQHQELIVILNRIGRFKCGKESFLEAFNEIQNFANIHFVTEENYMEDLKYSEFAKHKYEHDKFIEKLKHINNRIDNIKDYAALGEYVYEYVGTWILKHYSYDDVQLAEYIKQNI